MTKRPVAPKPPPHLPPIPGGFTHLDSVLPSYRSEKFGLAILIDHVDAAQRQFEKRFVVQHIVADTVMTDHWNEVLQIISKAEDDLLSWNAEKHLFEKP